MNKSTRKEVYANIDSELEYAHARWPGHKHSILEYAVYMEQYIDQIKKISAENDDELVHELLTDIVRKVGGLAVTCLEEHGSSPRLLKIWSQDKPGGIAKAQ